MRYWAIGWAILAAGMVSLTVGCESESASEETAEYDPKIDAPPTNLVVRSDQELLEDQALVAARDAKAASAVIGARAGAPAASRPAEDPAVAAVREIMSGLIDAGKGGQLSAAATYLSAADANAMKDTFVALGERAVATAAFTKVVKENLELKAVPASLGADGALGLGPKGGPALASVGDLATDMLEYELDGNSVTVTGGSQPLTFTQTGDAWKIELSDTDRAAYAALGALARIQARFATTLATGITEGAITEDNLDQKGMALMEELVKPALDKLNEAMAGGGGATP